MKPYCRFDGTYFTAEKAGIYLFSLAFDISYALTYGRAYFYIEKDGYQTCVAKGTAPYNDPYGEDTNLACTAVLELQPGDRVDVYSAWPSRVPSWVYCSFSGVLIRAYD